LYSDEDPFHYGMFFPKQQRVLDTKLFKLPMSVVVGHNRGDQLTKTISYQSCSLLMLSGRGAVSLRAIKITPTYGKFVVTTGVCACPLPVTPSALQSNSRIAAVHALQSQCFFLQKSRKMHHLK